MDDDINLIKIFLDIWEGKLKIISSASIALLIALGFNFFSPKPHFEATTEIKPISSFEAVKYNLLNLSIDEFREKKPLSSSPGKQDYLIGENVFFKITPQNLLSLYLEQLEYKTTFIKTIDELGIFQKSDFETINDYNSEILRFISNIEILPPKEDRNNERKYHQIKFTYNDEETWKKILSNFNTITEEFIRLEIIKSFNQNLSDAKQLKEYSIEDIEVQIENVLLDYDTQTSKRLAYLDEQKQIARKLGVAKNTIDAQIFDTTNGGTVVNFETTDTPFYLHGYEAIEEEIKLIKNRYDKKLFINDLAELENKKRTFKQDKTIERAENLFFKTPLVTKDYFAVVNLDVEATNFKSKNNKITILISAIFFGAFFGVLYVLISNAMINKKIKLKK